MSEPARSTQPLLRPRDRLLIRLLGPIGAALVGSLRIELDGAATYHRFRAAGQPVMFAVWHAQLLLMMRHAREFGVVTLASPTRDGEIGAQVGAWLGVVSERGDERYGPLAALRRLHQVLRGGTNLGLFPDGPLGPAGQVKPGTLMLAQRAGCPILPVGGDAAPRLALASGWDRFILPLPYAKVRIRIGAPLWVPADADGAGRAVLGEELARRMTALTDAMQAELGH